MSELVTEARVDVHHDGSWDEGTRWLPVPEATDVARNIVCFERGTEDRNADYHGCPVRVVDSAGVVVAQWGRP